MYNQFSDIDFTVQESNHSFYDFFEQDLDYSIYNIKEVLTAYENPTKSKEIG